MASQSSLPPPGRGQRGGLQAGEAVACGGHRSCAALPRVGGIRARPINKDVTLRNAAAFPTAKSGAGLKPGLGCVGLHFWWHSHWVIKMISPEKLAKGRWWIRARQSRQPAGAISKLPTVLCHPFSGRPAGLWVTAVGGAESRRHPLTPGVGGPANSQGLMGSRLAEEFQDEGFYG